MPIYQGQNYKVNRKVKEAVDKNQVNYRESADSPISIIKRVYVYITDKKGNVLPEVTVTIDDETITTGYGGLLISNFPNEEKTITVSKEGYKTATATIILDAEKQTHKFFLALETDNDESEVISTDDTKPQDEILVPCDTLFELSNNNTLISWGVNVTNEIVDGVYTGRGSYIEQGWLNEGLWQIDYDVKYNTTNSSYVNYYAGVMPFCSEEINPYTNEKKKNYCMESWEKWATIEGLDATLIEGPNNYKYSQQNEYQHVTVKKTASNKIEYYFDNNKWIYSVPKLQNLETLHFGYRDNPSERGRGVTISTKDLLVRKLCPKTGSGNNIKEENWLNKGDDITITFKNENNDFLSGTKMFSRIYHHHAISTDYDITLGTPSIINFIYDKDEEIAYIFFANNAIEASEIYTSHDDINNIFAYNYIVVVLSNNKITITPNINGVETETQEFTLEDVQCIPNSTKNNNEIKLEYIVPNDLISTESVTEEQQQEEGANTNNNENQTNETKNYTEYEGYMYYIKNDSLSPKIEIRSLIDENFENLIIKSVIDLVPISVSPEELNNNVITDTIIPISLDEDPNYTFKGYHPSNNNIEYKFFGFEIPPELLLH